jgi:rhombotail lipoprotein
MQQRSLIPIAILLGGLGTVACVAGRPLHLKSSALEYLYPAGKEKASPPSDVKLKVPIRVGLAFAPSSTGWNDPFTEVQKQNLLNRVADAFRDRKFIASIESIPSTYLTSGGGFAELDRLASAFGIALVALVSYDQRQFTESTGASWTYLTVVGAFAVQGEKNETRTLMDTVVYDIPSRALLFRSAGQSSLQGRSTPVTMARSLRLDSEQSFESATDDLITNLGGALQAFQEQIKSGTVRGAGTPAIEVVQTTDGGGSGGAGAIDAPMLLAALTLVALLGAGGRRLRGRCREG